jgi:hypothetical protein
MSSESVGKGLIMQALLIVLEVAGGLFPAYIIEVPPASR